MGNPAILYDGKTLTFPESNLTSYRLNRSMHADRHTADGGITETVRLGVWDSIEIALDPFTDAAFWRKLHPWWEWAGRGKQFAFTMDSTNIINTTLSANAAVGAVSLSLTSTAGLVSLRYYRIRSADFTKSEIVRVDTLSNPINITADGPGAGLIYGYSTGDVFREVDYFPKLVIEDTEQPFRENPVLTYSLRIRAREDRA